MKILLSPSKSLLEAGEYPNFDYSSPQFLTKSKKVNQALKKLKPTDLMALQDISDKLAELNYHRNKSFKPPFSSENARPAIFSFSGDVYDGLQAHTLSTEVLSRLNERIMILSGLYGILKPFDFMQPYRLEMGTSLGVGEAKNLYEFWKKDVTAYVKKQLSKDELLVNLASKEYASAVDLKAFKTQVVEVDFKDFHNGQLKMISFFAKKARGMMARFLVESEAESLDDIKLFNSEGYAFDEALSNGNKLVFTR
ncbi:peroxide stress protein YaaA [Flavobacterium sp.]|uniref:peroxide stress protein YaaA n=1 Tax=Flavobacterium sp. TaxID=239 RepID=UPI002637AD5A|nr:peroxide stress protein YaaA [Flavobacterium sp.]